MPLTPAEIGATAEWIAAVQLPEGASLGRTATSLEAVRKVAQAIPGVQEVIALSGMSVLDNSADLANAGTTWVMLKPKSR